MGLGLRAMVWVAAVAAPLSAYSSQGYEVKKLVSDQSNTADKTDPNLKNAWGIVFNPTAYAWVVNNGSNTSTLYDGTGAAQPLVVDVAIGSPTGVVYNASSNFVITQGTLSGPARFIFATEGGRIAAFAPDVDPTHALTVGGKDSDKNVFKGLAIVGNGTGNHLYATDFAHNAIVVFDKTFTPVKLSGSFVDATLPAGYAPFGIQNILGNLYVTYAKQDSAKHDDVKGPGFGYVSVFDPDGHWIRRFASQGSLNAPWGIALAPSNFGIHSDRILIANFGDGEINAFDLRTGHHDGTLSDPLGQPLQIDGLWGIAFGNGFASQPTKSLFFTAGPGGEQHGLYGRIEEITTPTSVAPPVSE